MSGCRHNLKELMVRDYRVLECIGLYYCMKCNKIFRKTLTEVQV